METERRESEGVREFRLEGSGLALISGVLVVALVGAFFLGRWYERSTQPLPLVGAGGADPLAHVVEAEEPADIDQTASYFDTVEGEGKEPEPAREMAEARPQARDEAGAPAASDSAGPFYVQVFAGRDRRAAESLIARLKEADYRVRLFSERSGQEALFKVRVGGYASDGEARAAAKTLAAQGYGGAWVTRVE